MSSWETRRNTVRYSWWKKDLRIETTGDPISLLRKFIWHSQGSDNTCSLFNKLERKPQAVWGTLTTPHLEISPLQIHHSIPFGITYISWSTPHREWQMKQRLFFLSVIVKKWTIDKEYRGREKNSKIAGLRCFIIAETLPSKPVSIFNANLFLKMPSSLLTLLWSRNRVTLVFQD